MSGDFKNCVGFSVIKLEPHKNVIKLGIACVAGGLRVWGRKSLIAEDPLININMKLSMEYFDSEALIKQQQIGSFKIPPPFPAKLPSNAPPEYDFSLKHVLCDQRML